MEKTLSAENSKDCRGAKALSLITLAGYDISLPSSALRTCEKQSDRQIYNIVTEKGKNMVLPSGRGLYSRKSEGVAFWIIDTYQNYIRQNARLRKAMTLYAGCLRTAVVRDW